MYRFFELLYGCLLQPLDVQFLKYPGLSISHWSRRLEIVANDVVVGSFVRYRSSLNTLQDVHSSCDVTVSWLVLLARLLEMLVTHLQRCLMEVVRWCSNNAFLSRS